MSRLTAIVGALFFSSLVSPGLGAVLLDFHDPAPAGPSAGTAGETLETGAPFTIGELTVTATPTGTSLNPPGLLANATAFGVDSNNFSGFTDVPEHIQFDGGEKLAITFNLPVEVTQIDLQGVDVAPETARVTIGSFTVDLFTGASGFNGTTDVYTPTTPIFIPVGTPIVFEGIAAGGAFGLEGITLNVLIPEPVSLVVWISLAIAACVFCLCRGRCVG